MCNDIIGEITGVIEKSQGDQEYLFGTIRSDKIKNVTYIPVIESSRKSPLYEITENGYQRPGSLNRMKAFAKYLEANRNSVVPPILLSGRGTWQFHPDSNADDIGYISIQDRAAVIDGQHRVGGFVLLYELKGDVRDVSFILLPNLTPKQEEQEFVTVNNYQKGVPKPLTAYLEDTEEAQVAWGLNEFPVSPFEGRITRTTMDRQHLFALHSVAKQVNRLFSAGAVQDLEIDQKIEFMSQYWLIIADALDEEWSDIEKLDNPETRGRRDFSYKLLELTGLIAWAYTGVYIFSRSYSETTGMNWDNVKRLVEAAADVDWDKDGQYSGRTGEAGGKIIADDMIRLLPTEAT